jgi:hypothetical protein
MLGTASARLCVRLPIAIVGMMAAAGCASMIEGRSQRISIATNPPAARCALYREQGMRIGIIESTPGDVLVEKTKTDIWIVCLKPGYQAVSYRNHSGVSGAAFVNVIGGIFTLGISTAIGVAVDSSNGADNKYQSPVNITMLAQPSDQPASLSVLPSTFDPGPGSQTTQSTSIPPSASTPDAADPSIPRPAPARADGTLPAAGIWECGLWTGKRAYKLQFVVGADRSIVLTTYANAPATIVRTDPLTMTANDPRGDRPMDIVWNADNTMTITGPYSQRTGATLHDSGTCTKV